MKLKGLAITALAAMTMVMASCGVNSTSGTGNTASKNGASELVSVGTNSSSTGATSSNGEGASTASSSASSQKEASKASSSSVASSSASSQKEASKTSSSSVASSTSQAQENKTLPSVSSSSQQPVVIDNAESALVLNAVGGDQESAYAEFSPVEGADSYNAYYKMSGASTWTKIDDQLIRLYKKNGSYYYRVDAVGLKAGVYSLKINPVINGTEADTLGNSASSITVIAYDRSGFAFSTDSPLKGEAPGAYNLDGTLKSGAQVIYVSESNKTTVTATVAGTEYTGVAAITEAIRSKKTTTPYAIRILGKVTSSGLICDSLSKWYAVGVKEATNFTIEGIGDDATLYGLGVGFNKCTSVECRNLGLMNWGGGSDGDGIAMQGTTNAWIHDNDLFYGNAGSDGDQAKGDGSMDLKDDSQYVTISYMHFWDSGKMSLCGMKSESGPNYITYHHNWFDHSDSRHPRIRTMSVHVYNNYFDGNSKYGVGVTTGADAFVENNYFRNCKNPMLSSCTGTDALGDGTFSSESSGTIKAFNNTIIWEGTMAGYSNNLIYANAAYGNNAANPSSYDAVLVSSRTETIPSTYNAGGATYNNFDTSVDLGVAVASIQDPEASKNTVEAYAGRINGGDFQWTFDNSSDDTSYSLNSALKTAINNYSSNLISIQGIENQSSSTDDNGSGSTETPVTVTYTDVITLIDNLPATIQASDKSSITAARTAYESLSADDKALVTNYSKLQAAEEALAALPQEAEVLTFDSGSSGDNSFFTVSGNLKSNVAAKTYDGVTYSSALKMESSTSISFTTTATTTITIITDTASKKIKINGTSYTTDANGVVTLEISAKTYTITKGDSINVYAIIIE